MEEFIMARQSKREYLRSIYKRYQHAGRAEKGRIGGCCNFSNPIATAPAPAASILPAAVRALPLVSENRRGRDYLERACAARCHVPSE